MYCFSIEKKRYTVQNKESKSFKMQKHILDFYKAHIIIAIH